MKLSVSVLMAVFNAEKYVRAAIDSILSQSFREFEFIIIDDASQDQSVQIISTYQDERVRLVRNEENIGLTRSLNKALDIARGTYIARMDADDISDPTRLEKQVSFLDAHPEVGVCGSWTYYLRTANKRELWKYPKQDEVIRIELLLRNQLAHPSIMLRRSIIEVHQLRYNSNYYTSQDYDLWVRMSDYCQLANLPEPLISYRHHAQSVSATKQRLQRKNTNQIRLYQLNKLGIYPNWQQWKTHLTLVDQRPLVSTHELQKRHQWLITLQQANRQVNQYPYTDFNNFLTRQWRFSIQKMSIYNVRILYLCLISPFPFLSTLKNSHRLHFLAQCIWGSFRKKTRKL